MHPTTETETMTTTKPTTRRIYVACLAAYNAGKLHGAWIDTEGKDADEIEREVVDRVMLTSPEPNVTRCKVCHQIAGVYDRQAGGVLQRFSGPCEAHPESVSPEDHDPAPSSEEWAIHDTDGFGGMIEEYTSLERVAMISALLEDHDPEVVAYAIGNDGAGHNADADQRYVESWISDHYAGAWDSLEDFAQSDSGPGGVLTALFDPSENPYQSTRRVCTRTLGDMPFGCSTLAAYIDWEKVGRDLELGGDVFTVRAKNGGVHVFWNR